MFRWKRKHSISLKSLMVAHEVKTTSVATRIQCNFAESRVPIELFLESFGASEGKSLRQLIDKHQHFSDQWLVLVGGAIPYDLRNDIAYGRSCGLKIIPAITIASLASHPDVKGTLDFSKDYFRGLQKLLLILGIRVDLPLMVSVLCEDPETVLEKLKARGFYSPELVPYRFPIIEIGGGYYSFLHGDNKAITTKEKVLSVFLPRKPKTLPLFATSPDMILQKNATIVAIVEFSAFHKDPSINEDLCRTVLHVIGPFHDVHAIITKDLLAIAADRGLPDLAETVQYFGRHPKIREVTF